MLNSLQVIPGCKVSINDLPLKAVLTLFDRAAVSSRALIGNVIYWNDSGALVT